MEHMQSTNGQGVSVTRIIKAPRERVFRSWTEAHLLMRWWAPNGCSTPACTVDLRIGGRFHYCVRLPDGHDIWGLGIYREIVAPERIVYTDMFADAAGRPVLPTHYGMSAAYPHETQVTVLFEDLNGMTRLTIHHGVAATFQEHKGIEQGWNEMLDHLVEALAPTDAAVRQSGGSSAGKKSVLTFPSEREFMITRVFDAPRALVFRSYTDPQLIPRWWGPRGFTTVVEQMDVRPGGRWRFVQRDPKGMQHAFNGIYRDVRSPERLVYTFEYEGTPGHVMVETDSFSEIDGKTLLTVNALFDSNADRDAMIRSGMEEGSNQTMERLAELLATTPATV